MTLPTSLPNSPGPSSGRRGDAGRTGRQRLAPLRRPGGRPGDPDRAYRLPGRRLPAGLDRQSAFHAGDDRIPGRHRRPHRGSAAPRRHRSRRAGGTLPAPHRPHRPGASGPSGAARDRRRSAGVIAAAHLWSPRIPGPLIAVALASAAVATLHLDRQGVTLLGAVSGGLPSVSFPMPAFADFRPSCPSPCSCPWWSWCRRRPPPGPSHRRARRRMGTATSWGWASPTSSAGLLGAFPVNASPPRTAIVAESGGRSQLASLLAVAVVDRCCSGRARCWRWFPGRRWPASCCSSPARIVRVGEIAAIARASPVEVLLIVATAAGHRRPAHRTGCRGGDRPFPAQRPLGRRAPGFRPMRRIPGTTVWWPVTPRGRSGSAARSSRRRPYVRRAPHLSQRRRLRPPAHRCGVARAGARSGWRSSRRRAWSISISPAPTR